MLNNRPSFAAIVENNNFHNNCDVDLQTRISELSHSNLAKYFGKIFNRSNRNTSNKNISSTEQLVSVPNESQLKRFFF